jgi:hypothetical protein
MFASNFKNVAIVAFLCGPAWFTTGLQVGDNVCVEGFVMDSFCIELGTLMDNPSVVTLEGPDQHSLHCLLDIEECVTSPFEVLLDPEDDGKTYQRGWRLGDATRALVVSAGQAARSNISQGLRVMVNGNVTDIGSSGVPPTVSGTDVRVSNFLKDPCAIVTSDSSSEGHNGTSVEGGEEGNEGTSVEGGEEDTGSEAGGADGSGGAEGNDGTSEDGGEDGSGTEGGSEDGGGTTESETSSSRLKDGPMYLMLIALLGTLIVA